MNLLANSAGCSCFVCV